jgi:hypothetical protein
MRSHPVPLSGNPVRPEFIMPKLRATNKTRGRRSGPTALSPEVAARFTVDHVRELANLVGDPDGDRRLVVRLHRFRGAAHGRTRQRRLTR